MKSILSIIVISVVLCFSLSAEEPVLISEGKCFEVLSVLQKQTKCDSLAVKQFWARYVVVGNYESTIVKQKPSVVIQYFNKASKKEVYCCLKELYHMRTLLDSLDRNTYL